MKHIDPERAAEMLAHDPTAILVDVRELGEIETGIARGARPVPLSTLPTKIGELGTVRAVMFICRSGRRSTEAAMFAQSVGLENVYNVSGGMIAWEEKKLPIDPI